MKIWCVALVSLLLTLNCFTPVSSVSVVDFERENVCQVSLKTNKQNDYLSLKYFVALFPPKISRDTREILPSPIAPLLKNWNENDKNILLPEDTFLKANFNSDASF